MSPIAIKLLLLLPLWPLVWLHQDAKCNWKHHLLGFLVKEIIHLLCVQQVPWSLSLRSFQDYPGFQQRRPPLVVRAVRVFPSVPPGPGDREDQLDPAGQWALCCPASRLGPVDQWAPRSPLAPRFPPPLVSRAGQPDRRSRGDRGIP